MVFFGRRRIAHRRALRGSQCVAQGVAEEVERQHVDEDHQPWPEHEVGRVEDVAIGRRDHRAPLGIRRLHTEAEEAEGGDLQDGGGEAEGRLHDQWRQRVREHAVTEQPAAAHAEGPVGGDEVLFADRQHLATHDPGVGGHADDGDRHHAVDQPAPEHRDDENGQQQRWEREQDVHTAHQDVVEAPAEEPGDETDDRADHHGENDRRGAGEQRDARPEDDPAELVAAVLVEAHQVLDLRLVTAQPVDARSFQLDLVGRRVEEDLGGVIGGDQRSEHGHPDDQRGEGETDAARPRVGDLREHVAPPARRRHRHVRMVGARCRRSELRRPGNDVQIRRHGVGP